MASSPTQQREQLDGNRRKVDFDTYDITVDELVRRVSTGRIEVAPSYQRQFRWDEERQSRLIESVLLGIPIPPLFLATNIHKDQGASWEIVDGLQRLMSLVHFVGDGRARDKVLLAGPSLKLERLEQLTLFNGLRSPDLPPDVLYGLRDRPLKVIVLNDKSDLQVRYDLFERLNTGGVPLTDQEIREAVFEGPFITLLNELASSEKFHTSVVLPAPREKDGTRSDYVLRFFAFLDRYADFKHSVRDFLVQYCIAHAEESVTEARVQEFTRTFDFLSTLFPEGITRGTRRTTPVNLFEAVAVGAALALRENPGVTGRQHDLSWMQSAELRRTTTGATNSRLQVVGRIEFCRDRFLGLPWTGHDS